MSWADVAAVKLEGDLPEELRTAIVTAIGRKDAAARSRAQARRRLAAAAVQAKAVLASRGYYDPDIDARVDVTESEDESTGRVRPVLSVDTGPLFTIDRAELEFAGGIYDQEAQAREQLTLPSGSPAEAPEVIAAGLRVVNWLQTSGYPDAKLLNRDAVVDHDADIMSVTYTVDAGPKVRFGEIVVTGDAYLRPGWADMVADFDSGDVYDAREINELTNKTVSTAAFGQAIATLDDETETENADGTVTRNVQLNIEQGPQNTVGGSVGFSTTDGSGVGLEYTRRNFVGYAQTLRLTANAKTNQISFGANYFIPYFTRNDRSLQAAAEIAREDTDAFDGERASADFLLQQLFSERLTLGLGAGVEVSRFTQNDLDREFYIAEVIGRGQYDARNDILDPSKGFLIRGEVVPSYNFGDEPAPFIRADVGASAYQRVTDEFVLAGRVEAGGIFGTTLDNVPFNRRFYAGGGGSVRGFGFQEIGPQDEFDEPTGGRSIVEGSAEVRWRSKTLLNGAIGGAVFVDAASVATPTLADFSDVRYGAGFGVRYYTAFAPLRADIAFPINPRDGDDPFQIYISIGQAF